MKLKVCGLTQLEQIKELIDLRIDFLGFIFYEKSPRYVLNHLSLKDIAQINHQAKVGVFVNESVKGIVEIVSEAQLDIIQLHGDEDEKFIALLREFIGNDIKIIKVIRVGESLNLANDYQNVDFLLFDTDSKAYGGTGKTFNWQLINQSKLNLPYFLSGGISNENTEWIKNLNQKPMVLDINSKFEIEPGNKDINKIKEFKNQINKYKNEL